MKVSMATCLAAMAVFQLATAAPTTDPRIHGDFIADQTIRWFHPATGVDHKVPVQDHKDSKHKSMLKRDVSSAEESCRYEESRKYFPKQKKKPVSEAKKDNNKNVAPEPPKKGEEYDALQRKMEAEHRKAGRKPIEQEPRKHEKNKGDAKATVPRLKKNARGIADPQDRKVKGGASFEVDGVSGGIDGVSVGIGEGRAKREVAGKKKKPWSKHKSKGKAEPEPEPEPKPKPQWTWPKNAPLSWWDNDKDRIQPPTRINEEDQFGEKGKARECDRGGYGDLKKSSESAAESVAEEVAEEAVEREKEEGKAE